ncbi:MlaE family ABC transporter permease [Nannocystis radixulma]|uniref:ABC transporter permease n=1 Tax=Nannocystis radixulma TaxID=2995305 RepID=A0ABT5B0C2_9BACT|nr:ABC transporter permease [Nannocystis radixulma]MDC0667188.1 ABC transporter permease [Nannocystis radixulma]
MELVGRNIRAGVDWAGGISLLLVRALLRGVQRPWGVHDVFRQVVALGVRSLPLSTLMGVFIGMALTWQFGEALASFGAKNAVGKAAALALVRELVPALMALTIGAKISTGITAELGSMKVSEQIDAIASLGADPVKKLVWPRVAASAVALPLLNVYGNVLALFGGAFIADLVFDVPAEYFYETYVQQLHPLDYVSGLVKSATFGVLVGLIGCYQGFQTGFGTEAVGSSTTQTVVATSIAIIVFDFVLTTVFLPAG